MNTHNPATTEEHYRYQLTRLTEIGLALSAEKDINVLLDTILSEARAFANADAGTLYLIDEEGQNLHFAILQNDTMKARVLAGAEAGGLPPVPLYIDGAPNHQNVSSNVALTGEPISIPDVYDAEDFDFTGPRRYDESTGYRSKSMLVLPMKDYQSRVIGVLQLLNAKDPLSGELQSFGQEQIDIVASLTSVASVALTNTRLTRDLSEELDKVRELQSTELELNQKLTASYLELEHSTEDLSDALGKVRVIRRFAAAFLFLSVLGGGAVYAWNQFFFQAAFETEAGMADRPGMPGMAGIPVQADGDQGYIVEPRPISSSISLSGRLAPLAQVPVVSPFEGKVAERFFVYGEQAAKGQLLVRMDTTELEVKIREAKSSFIQARQTYRTLKDWDKGMEVTRALRSLARVNANIESGRIKLAETQALYDKGIIARSEFDSATEQFENLKYELKSTSEEVAQVLDKGRSENVEVARLEFENARVRFKELRERLNQADVHAPVAGVVILPLEGSGGKGKRIERGSAATRGEVLVSLGNLEGLTVKAQVDEIDVAKIREHQSVAVSGDAFPDLSLSGRVTSVSSQAGSSGYSQVPSFDVTVTINSLSPAQLERLRLGMSCNLEVSVYNNPEALLVPIPAVTVEDGQAWLWVKGASSGEAVRVPVKTGMTTIDSVEILQGLAAGDEVIL